MNRRASTVLLAAALLAIPGVSGCTDNNCQDQSICGDHNSENDLADTVVDDESASGSQPDPPSSDAAEDGEEEDTDPPAAATDAPDEAGSTTEEERETREPATPREVPLRTLCASADDNYVCGAYLPRSMTVGDRTFAYVGETNPHNHSFDWKIVMGMNRTTCTSLKLAFAGGDSTPTSGEVVRLRVTQENAEATEESQDQGGVGEMEVALVGGGSFKIEGSASDDTSVVVNGTAMCTTLTGK